MNLVSSPSHDKGSVGVFELTGNNCLQECVRISKYLVSVEKCFATDKKMKIHRAKMGRLDPSARCRESPDASGRGQRLSARRHPTMQDGLCELDSIPLTDAKRGAGEKEVEEEGSGQ